MNANGSFKGQQAPCGRIVDGESYEDHDDEVVVTQEIDLCVRMPEHPARVPRRRVSRRIVRHDGHVLVDELLSAE